MLSRLCRHKWLRDFAFISDSNGTTVEKKGNKEFFNDSEADDKGTPIEEDEIINLDPNDILMNTVAESLADAVKTEL